MRIQCTAENKVTNMQQLCLTDGNYACYGGHFIMYTGIKSLCCTLYA